MDARQGAKCDVNNCVLHNTRAAFYKPKKISAKNSTCMVAKADLYRQTEAHCITDIIEATRWKL